MDSVGEGEGGKIWENGIETCEMSCMKRNASPGSMHDAGCLGLVHWDDPEGGYGEGGGRSVQDGFSFKNLEKKKKVFLSILGPECQDSFQFIRNYCYFIFTIFICDSKAVGIRLWMGF